MALNVQFYKFYNHLIDENVVMPRLVNQQLLDFNALCEYLADGSTVTPADVAAVMKQIEMRLPLVLGLNAKVICSPEGLTFRPKVTGSITQSQLKAKLQAKLAADPTLDLDVNRELTVSDLTTGDLEASIAIELPKKWNERFKTKAEFKRVNKTAVGTAEDDGQQSGSEDDNANVNPNANQNGGGTGTSGNTNPTDEPGGSGGSTGGSGNDDPDNGME